MSHSVFRSRDHDVEMAHHQRAIRREHIVEAPVDDQSDTEPMNERLEPVCRLALFLCRHLQNRWQRRAWQLFLQSSHISGILPEIRPWDYREASGMLPTDLGTTRRRLDVAAARFRFFILIGLARLCQLERGERLL